MSVVLDLWPPLAPEALAAAQVETQRRELVWIIEETLARCQGLKHGLEDCYALLAPIDPGCTLVMSTPRNEKVKGTVTRVGTRLVKGSLSLQLRTIPAQTISISPTQPIHVRALEELHTHLTQSVDLLALTVSQDPPHDALSLASTLAPLADALADSAALLKGPPLAEPDGSWQTDSCLPRYFSPPLPPNMSFHVTLQDASVVLNLRALEPAAVPVHFGTKLGLAIGTVRRLEHDEMDLVFRYQPSDGSSATAGRRTPRPPTEPRSQPPGGTRPDAEEVYVREKVRIESADPNLISVSSKLGYLSSMLNQMRRNLATVINDGFME